MPRAEQLPEELTELAYRNGVEVTHSRWDSDVQVLAKALSPYVESLNGRANAASSKKAVISKSNDASQSARSQKPSNAPLVSLPTAKTTFATILAASLALLVVGVSGYLWHQVSSESAQIARQAELLEEVKKKIAAEELNAKRRAEEKAMAEALEAKKQAAERALAAETEARRRVQEKALAQELEVQRQTQERMHAQELEAKKRAQEAELEKRRAEERAEEIALAEKRQAESRVRERAAAEEREKIRLAQERAAAQRARWPSYNFPPPNGGLLVYTIMPDGNPACASYDGGGCLWGVGYDQIDFRRLKPLVCGEQHRARFGVTGYENLKHWCSLARRLRR